MFASFKAEGVRRGTQILVSDSLREPFVPHSDGPVTPREWECLDGTFHVDSDGAPWMIFCHEWVQVGDGEMCAMRLTPELDAPVGEPVLLFHASDAPWVRDIPGEKGLVTDGPFMHRTQSGALLILWASFGEWGYAQGIARSLSGDILGPWEQEPEPLYSGDGGHGMIFRTFEGDLILALHTPNSTPDERPIFLPVEEIGDRLIIHEPGNREDQRSHDRHAI